jgi:prohibitin 1
MEQDLARAEAERNRIEAEGVARANRIVAESLTPTLIELRRVEALRAFAENKGTSTVVLPSNAVPLVQVK